VRLEIILWTPIRLIAPTLSHPSEFLSVGTLPGGKFFGAGNYGDSTSKALGSYTSLVLENPTTGQHVIWVFSADYQSLAAGYWLPTQAPEWHVANH
jgi:hypothetical protein